jgi:hypothetical protein
MLKKIITKSFISFLLLCLPLTSPLFSQENSFLLPEGPGAAIHAFGEAATSIPIDVSVAYYNPSLLSLIKGKKEIMVQYTPLLLDMSIWYGFLGARFNLKEKLSLSLSLLQLQASEIYSQENMADPPTSSSINNSIVYVSLSFPIVHKFTVGGNLKFISSSLVDYKSSSTGIDAGISYLHTFLDMPFFYKPTLHLGMSIQNILQPTLTFYQSQETLERVYRVGMAFSGNIPEMYSFLEIGKLQENRLTLSADLQFSEGAGKNKILPCFGAEFVYQDSLALRAGMSTAYSLTLGLGLIIPLSHTQLCVDYNYETSLLAPLHRIGVRYVF